MAFATTINGTSPQFFVPEDTARCMHGVNLVTQNAERRATKGSIFTGHLRDLARNAIGAQR